MNVQRILAAFQTISAGDIQNIEQANAFLTQWTQNPTSIGEAIQVFQASPDEKIHFQVIATLERLVLYHWANQTPQERKRVRDIIISIILGSQWPPLIRTKLISIIVIITLKDWPEEWPSCISDFINSAAADPIVAQLDFEILACIAEQLQVSENITEVRRKHLIEEFVKLTPNIMDLVEHYPLAENYAIVGPSVVKLISILCLYSPIEAILRPNFREALFHFFLQQEPTTELATEAISNLLINRVDAEEIVSHMLAPQQADYSDSSILGDFLQFYNNGTPPDCFHDFVLRFMDRYGAKIDDLCYNFDNPDEVLQGGVRLIYEQILNRPPIEEHMESFWTLWRNILQRYVRAKKSNNQFASLMPCLQLFEPMIPQIRATLFMGIASAVVDGRLASVSTQACWVFLSSIEKKEMVQFLLSQPPSIALCYATGLTDCVLNFTEENNLMAGILPRLFECQKANQNDIGFGVGLLYCLSHATRFLTKNPPIRVAFGQVLLTFLSSPIEAVHNAAVNELHYIAYKVPSFLTVEPNPICPAILSGLNNFIFNCNYEPDTVRKLLKSLSFLAGAQEDPARCAELYHCVAEPVVAKLMQSQDPTDGFDLIISLTKQKAQHREIFFNEISEPLIQTVQRVMEIEELFDSAMSALVAMYCQLDFDLIKSNLVGFVNLVCSVPSHRNVVISSLATLRRKFPGMEFCFDQVNQAIMVPTMSTLGETKEDADVCFNFYRMFDVRPEMVPDLLKAACDFVCDERSEVSREATKLIKRIILLLLDTKQMAAIQIIVDGRAPLINALFTALTDRLHNSIFRTLAKCLYEFYRLISITQINVDEFDQMVMTALSQVNHDVVFLKNFAVHVRGTLGSFDQFAEALRNFLIATKCGSAADSGLFKKEFKLSELKNELRSLLEESEKNAIKSEELSILPALAKL